MSFIVTAEWVSDRLKNNLQHMVIVDVRFQLTNPDAGRQAYLQGHLPRAVYLDLNKDLSGPVLEHGGNHPLPSQDQFVKTLGDIGVDQHTTVVVYDKENDMFASRFWWLLHYYGHENVYVLEGGFSNWVEQGNETTTVIPKMEQKKFVPNISYNEVVNVGDMKRKVKQDESVLVDSREKQRYLGEVEPLYSKAGHIPGAKNFFWKDVLKSNGKWKSASELQSHFSSLSHEQEIIVSCGSGVSACPNILALKQAGFKNIKLYPGSYSDWISYPEHEVSTNDE